MQNYKPLLLLTLISSNVLACANHFGTTVPHIYDEEFYLKSVENQKSEIKTLTLEDMLNGVAAASPETEKKNKFMEYYKNNVLNKHKNE